MILVPLLQRPHVIFQPSKLLNLGRRHIYLSSGSGNSSSAVLHDRQARDAYEMPAS